MKNNYTRIALLLIISITLTCSNLFAHHSAFATNKNYINQFVLSSFKTDDSNLKLEVMQDGSHIELHVSYNGTEGTNGTLRILNASTQPVSQFDIKLIKQPDFITLRLDEYAAGIYSAEVTTANGIHIAHFTIK
jgi:hypothetical protein